MKILNGIVIFVIVVYGLTVAWSNRDKFGESAVHVRVAARRTEETHRGAEIVATAPAEIAPAARHRRVDRDPLAHEPPISPLAGLDDFAGKFMAEDERPLEDKGTGSAMGVIMDVGAADTGPANLNDKLTRRGIGPFNGFRP